MPILRDPPVFEGLICAIAEKLQNHYPDVELIAGVEARGFLFGPSVAAKLGIGFIPVCKRGKLPGKVVQMSYEYDFGQDTIEIQEDSVRPDKRVIVLDDLLATGGTLAAAVKLLQKLGADVLSCLAVIEGDDMEGRKRLGVPCLSLIVL